MFSLQRLLNSRWLIPVVAGLLIVVAATLGFSQGVNPFSGTSHGLTNLGDTPNVALLVADLLMIAAAVVAGHRIVIKAIQALTIKDISIDLLVSIAAIGAIIIGSYWEAAAVTWLFAIGHALETATMNKTRSALAELVAVAPDTAVVLRDGEQVEVPAAQVMMDEIVLVKNGAKVPVDGDVVAGTGALNEASITGESIPAEKNTGDQVFAGTISTGGFLQVRATGIGADTTLARIIHRVEEAQDAKARTQTFIDRFSTWYTPAIILLALVTGLITRDVTLALTLLVIGCPGALVISIPVAIVAGIGRAARDGILIKGGEFLENAAKIDAVALDKTGTLTEGRPVLTDVVVTHPDYTRTDVLTWAARAEAGSEHPLARPILDAAAAEDIVYELPEVVTPIVGKGITANVSGRTVLIGNQALMDEFELSDDPAAATAAQDLARAGRTPMIVAVDTDIIGVVAVADQVRPEARQMIDELHAAGVQKVVMLTGDTPLVAHAIGAQTGVDDIRAGLLPEDKLDEVAALQRDGYTVAMVGDGVNDAPALATADIGVAMGAAGSAVAVETADIALMGDKLLRLPQAIALAKRTVAIMRQNIAIALITVVLLLAGVFAGGVTMSIGMLVHEASVLLVIANAMRLMRQVRPTPPSSKAQSKTQSDVASQPQADEPVASATSR